jgi:hypothetical protein
MAEGLMSYGETSKTFTYKVKQRREGPARDHLSLIHDRQAG